jgi:pimeloyl-ACP methyl ester carboxylesterase
MMPFLQINKSRYYLERLGSGFPIILIAGYGCSHHFWDPISEQIKHLFELILIDNRGSGQTIDNKERLTTKIMADDIASIITKLNLNKPHIIGQSMGGSIAQELAIRHPDKISKLILLNTVTKWSNIMLALFRGLIGLRENKVDIQLQLNILLPLLLGNHSLKNAETINKTKNLLLTMPYPQSLFDQKRQFDVLKNHDTNDKIKHIQADTLVGISKEDVIINTDESMKLVKGIADAKVHYLPGGHQSPTEATEEVINIMGFLQA